MNLVELEKFILELDEKESNIKKLEKICNFLASKNIVFNDDVYTEIFSIKKIEYIISYILNKKIDNISLDNIIELSNNNLFLALITKYCELNNIIFNKNEDEVELDTFENIDNYDSLKIYINDLNKPLLSVDEEKKLGYRILNGDLDARNELIERNLRLVVNVVTAMKRKFSSNISYMDMISYGNEGLIAAADKYDVRTGFRFSSYAIPCIKQKIRRGIVNNSRVIKVPERVLEIDHKYQTLINLLQNKLMREITLKDISLITNLSIKELSQFRLIIEEPVSLNQTLNDEDTKENELIDFIADDDDPIFLKAEDSDKNSKFDDLFSNLNKRDVFVLICLYYKKMTLEQTGNILNISRERVRQIEARSLKKLREYVKKSGFNNYMNNPKESLEKVEQYIDKYGSSILVTEKYYKEPSKNKNKFKLENVNLTKISDCLDEIIDNFDKIDMSIFHDKKYSK